MRGQHWESAETVAAAPWSEGISVGPAVRSGRAGWSPFRQLSPCRALQWLSQGRDPFEN